MEEIREFGVYFNIPTTRCLNLMLIEVKSSNTKAWTHLLRRYTVQEALEVDASLNLGFHCLFLDDRENIVMLYEDSAGAKDDICHIVREALESEMGVSLQMEIVDDVEITNIADAYEAALERLEARGSLSPVVESAKDYIAQHYAEPDLEVTSVAEKLSLHPVYLSRLMKQELGMPFARYLTQVRISRALELMVQPNAKVWQIAEKVGYRSANQFSAAFKRILGVSPADYRIEGGQR